MEQRTTQLVAQFAAGLQLALSACNPTLAKGTCRKQLDLLFLEFLKSLRYLFQTWGADAPTNRRFVESFERTETC